VYYSAAKDLSTSGAAWVRQGSEFGYRAPLYFTYLGGVFTLFPQSGYRTAQVATSLLGVVTCVLLFVVAYRVQGAGAAKVAFWVRGLSLCFLLGDTFVMSEPLFAALQMASILVFVSAPPAPNSRHGLALGFLVGLSMLTRESASGYPLIFAGGLFLLGGPFRKRAATVALFFLAITITLLPWMWRNQIVWGRPLPLTLTSGPNLHIGNNPATTGHWQRLPESLPAYIRPGTPEANRWHTEKAIQYITSHPGRFIANGFKKVAWLVFPSFHRDPLMNIYSGRSALLKLMSVLSGGMSAVLILIGIAGFILSKPDRFWWLSGTMFAYYLGITYVAFGHPRLRDPLDHILICYVAAFVANWRNMRLQLQWRSPTALYKMCILGLVYGFIISNWVVTALGKV